MSTHWAIDLGTSNTTVCEDRSGRPHMVNLPDLVKLEPVTQTPMIASCVCVMNGDGSDVLIGQEAVSYNCDGQAAGFARAFKRYLGTKSQRTMAGAHRPEGVHGPGRRHVLPAGVDRGPRDALRRRSDGHHDRHPQLHAVEALPRLREMLRQTGKRNPTGQAIVEAIEALESRASLPRPADSVDAPAETLPRVAAQPGPDTSTLPKVVED